MLNPEAIGDPNATPVVYLGEEAGKALGIPPRTPLRREQPAMCICDSWRGIVCAYHRNRQREVLNEPVPEPGAQPEPDRDALIAALAEAQRERDEWKRAAEAEAQRHGPDTVAALVAQYDAALEAAKADADRYRHLYDEKITEVDGAVAKTEQMRDELRDARNDLLDVRGILSPNGYEPVTPLSSVPTVAPAVQWLVDERERMRPVVEAARALAAFRKRDKNDESIPAALHLRLINAHSAAVDTYEGTE